MSLVLSSLSQGLLWSIMAIGVYLTFRILDIADLTAEGSYPLGAAICATGIVSGLNPLLATMLAFGGGLLAGLVSGLIHTKLKIPALLTGIVTLTGLYSINLKVLGKANVALLRQKTLVTQLYDMGFTKIAAVMIIGALFAVVVIALLTLLMKTQIGLALRSTGDNIPMSESNGIKTEHMKMLGYMVSNGLIALCGALLCQNNGYADLNAGVGTIVIGLASIIIAEVMIRNLSIGWRLASIVLGSIVYRLIILAILAIPGMDADLVKLFSAILLATVLFVPELQKKLNIRKPKLG
ncbi:transport system permease [Streptococcus dysgalactiae subsp. dysgalactiae]|uniref:Transport system permease n=1 Tax=Streptococcus dysgalactiae subsp. dysgalactiae TaxID=99822 RepID=A0A380JXW7_STRDY|nr:ABC transporter permease [Streptococcus dysgalactiae]EFY01861.1 transport system permease protein [Streptococcus dysgalactiae subsp. dysgalactiae ATCC 27957]MCB2838525.1 ABC transporter permease [Streptococcus dysgalactiae subsp. dysgalactiae]MCB2846389.1 ABC transporter permease [Streptococcus dysgalactiae subsp. dysgalactiae]QQT03207.1 ABC transporter permease [Streptococcus dysgalactiae]SUN44124.1 transport system permease [Streptococcus dysgalactiae subsp. dysgalactiae]